MSYRPLLYNEALMFVVVTASAIEAVACKFYTVI